MTARPGLSRLLTVVAAIVLGFDGAVLAGLGLWTHRPLVVVMGVVLFVAAVTVLAAWRAQARRLQEISAARRELRDEARALDDFLRRN
jgi:type IV secretory pathway VirB2 component (pilin)